MKLSTIQSKISNRNFLMTLILIMVLIFAQCSTRPAGIHLAFTSSDVMFGQDTSMIDMEGTPTWDGKAWRGEKIHSQIIFQTENPIPQASIRWSDLKDDKGNKIPASNIRGNFVSYVMADGLGAKLRGCGMKPKLDSLIVADIIDTVDMLNVDANGLQPVWLSISVPENAISGVYKGSVSFVSENKRNLGKLNYSVQVIDRILPAPKDWRFHLDLWQNPDAIARVHKVEKWSDEHFRLMEPYMKMLANAGQKVITATLIHDPWNSQTHDVYSSMIRWEKKKDGSWKYDYTVFDRWVTFMQSIGIDQMIECYSMIPWNLKFYYFDEALGKDTLIIAKPGSKEYEAHWKPMLSDLTNHLKEKGWFEKTTIAMDERPMEAMQKAIAIIKSADKDFKVSLAGGYHPEIEEDLFDYCLASNIRLDAATLSKRKENGKITTFYTCCVEAYPNTFTISPPAEAAWLGWYAANKGLDGYLRWAYNSWPKDPITDSRFGRWPSGDTYLVYPGGRSSVRFEKLIEGIQDFEKIRILREEYSRNNNMEKSNQLERVLARFEIDSLKSIPAANMIDEARKELF